MKKNKAVMAGIAGLFLILGTFSSGVARAEEMEKGINPADVKIQKEEPKLNAKQRLEELRKQEAKMMEAQKSMQLEAEKFNQLQGKFCMDFRLDPNKFTQGLYIFDERKNEFKLNEAEQPMVSRVSTPEKKEEVKERSMRNKGMDGE